MTDYVVVLSALHPGVEWTLLGNDYETLEWFGVSPKPSQAELDSAWPDVQVARERAAVQEARAARYRVETDPLFFKAQRGEDDVTLEDWKAAVNAIRADLPYSS